MFKWPNYGLVVHVQFRSILDDKGALSKNFDFLGVCSSGPIMQNVRSNVKVLEF